MWLVLAFISATFLGFYDTSKKASLKGNAVLPVLFLNTVFSTLIFSPFLLDYIGGFGWFSGTLLDTAPFTNEQACFTQPLNPQPLTASPCSPYAARTFRKLLSFSDFSISSQMVQAHLLVVLKAFIVLSSWICGYFGLKHLPLTIVGPINATRPVMVLIGALTFFSEKLNAWQWIGVIVAMVGLYMLSRSSKKEGIDFKHNKWIVFVVLANVLGAISGLYDKFLMASPENGGVGLDKLAVQSWYNIYQFFMMLAMLFLLWWPTHKKTTPFHWDWCIILISVFLSAADFVYFYALGLDGAMISIVSMVRRGSVIVSFLFGAMMFHEKNLKSKLIDLALVLLSMLFLFIGSY